MATKDEAAITRGRNAQRILDDPLYKEAFETIERNIVNEIAKADTPRDRAEYLRLILMAGRKHRIILNQVIEDGKFAAESVKQEEERKRWFRPAA